MNARGFSIVEALLASTLFALMATTFIGAYWYGEESVTLSGNRVRASFLAAEGLDAVRNMRDGAFDNVIAGTHGLTSAGGVWAFSGVHDVTDIFTRSITVSDVDADRKEITSTVTWQQNTQRTGVVAHSTRLTRWREPVGGGLCSNQADALLVDMSGAVLQVGNRELAGVFFQNTDASCDIIIGSVTLTWTNVLRTLSRVRIENMTVWTGTGLSGTSVDITDYTIAAADGPQEVEFRFSGSMIGNAFSLVVTMSDGSSKTVTGIMP